MSIRVFFIDKDIYFYLLLDVIVVNCFMIDIN